MVTTWRTKTCRECGRPLKDRASLMWRVGPDCRKKMTGAQLAEALRLTREEAKPGYIPPERTPTISARLTNAAARRTIEQAQNPDTCQHGGLPGACLRCRQEGDLAWRVQQIITAIQTERARGARHPLRPWPLPYTRHTQPQTTNRRRPRRDTGQLTLEAV